tara:strand:+ start:239 stop:604 length:366 start_codon:yes stop_codon:yes gene_type:complete
MTKYRTNSNHVRLQVRQHIIDVVKAEDNCENIETIEGASQIILESFNDWDCDHERKRTPNNQERFSDWLWGLPFGFEYTYCGIADLLNGLGINPKGKEYGSDKSGKLYHYLIWSEIQKAVR